MHKNHCRNTQNREQNNPCGNERESVLRLYFNKQHNVNVAAHHLGYNIVVVARRVAFFPHSRIQISHKRRVSPPRTFGVAPPCVRHKLVTAVLRTYGIRGRVGADRLLARRIARFVSHIIDEQRKLVAHCGFRNKPTVKIEIERVAVILEFFVVPCVAG